MAKFVIRKNASNQYWFVMQANNNRIVLQSEMYTTKQGAQTGIQSIKKEAAEAAVVDDTNENKDRETSIASYR